MTRKRYQVRPVDPVRWGVFCTLGDSITSVETFTSREGAETRAKELDLESEAAYEDAQSFRRNSDDDD